MLVARSRLTCGTGGLGHQPVSSGRSGRTRTHLEPGVLVSEVMSAGSGHEAELGRRAAVLTLLVLGLDREFMAPYPARESFDSPQRFLGDSCLPCGLVAHPLEEPEVRWVLGGDFERDEQSPLGESCAVDRRSPQNLSADAEGLRVQSVSTVYRTIMGCLDEP